MLITPGLLTVLALVIFFLKLKGDTVRKLLSFDLYLDIAVTALLLVIFAGTFQGMMAAIVGGLAFSVTLLIMKWTMGYKKIKIFKTKDHFFPSVRWVYIPPVWGRRNRAC